MVKPAMKSSVEGKYHGFVARGLGIPNVERPRARRIMLSKCSRAAAVVAPEAVVADSRERAVAVEGMGEGR